MAQAVVKAVVLAAGVGRRMRAADGESALTFGQALAARDGHKAMMPVGREERPFIAYVLDAIAEAGCHDACLVVGPDHRQLEHYLRASPQSKTLQLTFAVQQRPEGTAHALLTARDFVGEAPFLVLNSDNHYPARLLRALMIEGAACAGFERETLERESGLPLERIASFALLDVDAEDQLQHLIEKPGQARAIAAGPHALFSMNVWKLDAQVFRACEDVPKSERGEYELPEAIGLAISSGMRIKVVRRSDRILDLSSRADIARVSAQIERLGARP